MKNRDTFFDSLKFQIMFLVILGHVIEHFRTENTLTYSLYLFIYAFHMALFAYISGYFSKKADSTKLRKGIFTILETYIVCQSIWIGIHVFAFGSEVSYKNFFVPFLTLWYLLSLICWRIISFILINRFSSSAVLVGSIILAVLVGFMPFIDRPLSLSRTFVFLPFFLAGAYSTNNTISYIRSIPKIFSSIAFLLLGIFIYAMKDNHGELNQLFHSSSSYHKFAGSLISTAIERFIFILFGFLLVFCYINIAPKTSLLAKYGTATLFLFIYHSFIVFEVFPRIYGHIPFTITLPVLLLISVVLTVLLCLLSRITFLSNIMNPLSSIKQRFF